MGDPVAEDMRYVVKAVVGEENFIDMTPNRSNNYCCGGGGGFLQNGLPTPCHNCHAQIHDLSEHFEGGYHSVHLWTLICLSLGILGENEREYLGPDLADVDVLPSKELEE
jgi:hypothetical protein